MAAHTTSTDPQPAFVFVGGRPSLNLVATVGKRGRGDLERLPDTGSLGRWLHRAGLVADPAAIPAASAADLAQARKLREAVYRMVHASLDGKLPRRTDLELVNGVAAGPDLAPRLVVDQAPDGAGLTAAWTSRTPVEGALSTIARDAVLLLSGPLADRVKECESPTCSLLFLDDSQARRRRWCSMDRCGNLAKVTKYRSRPAG